MKFYGYCRVSTTKQSLKRQQDNIHNAFPDAKCYSEEYTGTTSNRPQWQKLLKTVHEGDTIVFDSVSRMSRNAEEGFQDYKALFEMGVNLIFLKEPYVNTETYKQAMKQQLDSISTGDTAADELISSIMKALQKYQLTLAEKQIQLAFEQSEKEVKDIQQRTREGMKAAGAGEKISKARTGKSYTSKKEAGAKAIILKHSKSFGGTLADDECMKLAGVSFVTFYKYKKELKQAESERSE
ncbi:MAG: recombinase family protein [Oscillospiraceae bacterium]|nr:recombinase family protein [Oscillospiraceae bacterium]MBR7084737.1 recombinase family protein [Oscillospiraceae bacterium]